MPLVTFRTNLPDEKITEEFHKQFSAKLAEVLGKEEELVSVTIEAGRRMTRSGNFDPVCEVCVLSLGLNTKAQTQAAIEKLTPFIAKHTGIPSERVIMQFQAPEPFMVGVNGVVVS